MTTLHDPLRLPCGAVLSNRIAKAAMTEGLADARGVATPELEQLYRLWGEGGAGMLLSGNVQVDRDHVERPGNVIIDSRPDAAAMTRLSAVTKAATAHGSHFWAQISHAGRQTFKFVNPRPKAPSAVKLGLPGGQFGEPQALGVGEIEGLIASFALTAKVCKEAGFTGVQIHSAHGYLLSSFLSPRANQRTDDYGGSLANRARMLLAVVAAIRAEVGKEFPISVKLNSADFQRGGFAFEESVQVARWLEEASVDLIEISGGTYEQPKLIGMEGIEPEEVQNVAASTLAREAYFVDFAKAMQAEVTVPLMVTGGFRTRAAMEQAVAEGAADVVGIGRPMCVETDAPHRLLAGADALPRYEKELALLPDWLGWAKQVKMIRSIDSFAIQFWYYSQLYALGRTGEANPGQSVFASWREVDRTHKALFAAR